MLCSFDFGFIIRDYLPRYIGKELATMINWTIVVYKKMIRFLFVHIFLFAGFALAFHIQHQHDSDTIETNVGDGGHSGMNCSAVAQNNDSQQKYEDSVLTSQIMAKISKVKYTRDTN